MTDETTPIGEHTLQRAKATVAAFEPPRQIGPYHILELLGTGGFGEVYKAERRSPMRQLVAIKVIKLGVDTREVIARFESERQALARMDHPHVARVLDAGTTDAGRPYFVMEYVSGDPITKFADDNKLTIKDRLLLFTQVCDAIAHAHTKAMIHRDIKAGNVMAFMHDGKPTAKVIDFGIAKALTGDRLTNATFNTQRGQAIGTYETMSPEQAEGSPDIDTRTDVYSLGVLLYELLTGAMPFDSKTMAQVTDDELRRMIREVEPPRPSTRLSSLGISATKVAAMRRQQLDALTKQLRGELQWIPLKAMCKERDRRYSSVHQICEDINNYLEHRPLIAGPESKVYRIRKYLKRNKGPVLVGLAVTMAAVAITVAAVATRSAATANKAAQDANRKLALAMGRSDAVQLTSVPPSNPSASATADSVRISVPEDEAILRQAVERSRRELGRDSPETLGFTHSLALLLRSEGKLKESEILTGETLERRTEVLGSDHVDTLSSLNNLGAVLLAQRKLQQALPILTDALERNRRVLGDDDPLTLTSMHNLASLFHAQNNPGEAEQLYREALSRRTRVLGRHHPETLLSMNSLGALLRLQKNFAESGSLLREALAARQSVLGKDDRGTLMSLHDLGSLYSAQEKRAQAEPYFREALQRREIVLGRAHPDTLGSRFVLARLLKRERRAVEAEPLYQELYAGFPHSQILPGADAVYMSGYGVCLAELGRYEHAEAPLRQAYEQLNDTGRRKDPAMREVIESLALVCEKTNRADEAASLRAELTALPPPN